ncbi:putative Dipeptidyl peptidase 8 protein [Naja naja]|nr:putative Dipeptidyl peptidase 8 protein [Naja naja]
MRSAMKTEQPTLEIFETAEGKQNVAAVEETAKLEPYYVERYSWSHLKKLLADTRKYHSCLMAKTPHDFTFFTKGISRQFQRQLCAPHIHPLLGLFKDAWKFRSTTLRAIWFAMSGENRENILFYSEIPKTVNKAAILLLSWKPLIDLFQGLCFHSDPGEASTANPKVTFKLSEITLGSDGRILSAVDKELVQPFEILFDGIEYIARAGWTREGKYAWAILLDRSQTRLQIAFLPPALFIPVEDNAMERQKLIDAVPDSIHDIFHVFPQTQEDVVEFIFASECKTGFRHLYRISTVLKESKYRRSSGGLPAPSDFLCHVKEELPLTSGEWEVLGRHGSDDCDMVICKFSNQKCPHQVSLYKLTGLEEGTAQRAKEFWATILHSSGSLPDYVPPEVFSFESSSGFVLYGMIYKPHDLQPGKKYPTVLFIYGGPQVQLVNNRFKGAKYFRLNTLASLGYVVVVLDNRGSCHRGLAFEGAFKYKMVAVAGAPVTLWLFYDTGYTERYMGHPDNNEQAYYLGSVAMQAEKFPSE